MIELGRAGVDVSAVARSGRCTCPGERSASRLAGWCDKGSAGVGELKTLADPMKQDHADFVLSLRTKAEAGVTAEPSTDLVQIDEALAAHKPDIAYIPTADFHRLVGKGRRHYRGLAVATSKFTGEPRQRSFLVVRKDDSADALDDLSGAEYGYINKSSTSSYFPPAILLGKQRKKLDDFLKIMPVAPWQRQIDAAVAKEVRATMVLEDVWKMDPRNAQNTKISSQLDHCATPVVVVRENLNEALRKILFDASVVWVPKWDAVYGAFLITLPTCNGSSAISTGFRPECKPA